MAKELTLDEIIRMWREAHDLGLYDYGNGDCKHRDDEGIWHLMREGKEVAKGKWVDAFDNLDFMYVDDEDIGHLIRDGKEIAKGTHIVRITMAGHEEDEEHGLFEYRDSEGTHYCQIIDGYRWERKNKI